MISFSAPQAEGTPFRVNCSRNVVTLYMPIDAPPPESVPPQLEIHMSKEQFQERVRVAMAKASQYCRPRLELAWIIITSIITIVVPATISRIMLGQEPVDEEPSDKLNRFIKASMAAFITMIIGNFIFITPMAIWRIRGRSAVNAMLKQIEHAHLARLYPGSRVPAWSVKLPHAGFKTAKIIIALPSSSGPPYFAPESPLPLNPENTPAVGYEGGYLSYVPGSPTVRFDKEVMYDGVPAKMPLRRCSSEATSNCSYDPPIKASASEMVWPDTGTTDSHGRMRTSASANVSWPLA